MNISTSLKHNLTTAIKLGLAGLFKPAELTAVEWMDEHYYLPKENNYQEGHWETLPFQKAIINAMGSEEVQKVNLLKSARVGYSKMLFGVLAYFIAHKQRSIITWLPTDDDAKDFMKVDVTPTIRDVPLLLALAPWYGKKHKDNTVTLKSFSNGRSLRVLGGKSAKNYRAKSVDVVAYDELSSFDNSIEGEGSPISLGDKRIAGSVWKKSIRGSTPKIKGQCQMEKAASESPHMMRFHTRNLSREQLRLSADATKASSALMRQERRIISVNKAQAKMAANREVRQGIKNRALGTLSATPLGGVMTTALTAAPFVAAGRKSIDYEAAWADVQKVSNFKDAKQDRDVQLVARKQAGDLGMSQQGMTEILAAAGQAGVANDRNGNVDPKQLLRFGADASKASVALDISAKEAGDTMATLRTSMKLSQDGVMSLLDVINAESNKMNAKASVVAGIMKRQGANAVLAGFDGKQVAGLSSALVASGDTEETGSTALKNITGRLTMGFAATKNQKRSLSMLGFDPDVLAKDMQRDAGCG